MNQSSNTTTESQGLCSKLAKLLSMSTIGILPDLPHLMSCCDKTVERTAVTHVSKSYISHGDHKVETEKRSCHRLISVSHVHICCEPGRARTIQLDLSRHACCRQHATSSRVAEQAGTCKNAGRISRNRLVGRQARLASHAHQLL